MDYEEFQAKMDEVVGDNDELRQMVLETALRIAQLDHDSQSLMIRMIKHFAEKEEAIRKGKEAR